MRQLRSRLRLAYAAFDAAWQATVVGRVIALFTFPVLPALSRRLDFDPLSVIDTGNIRIDFPASFALAIAGSLAFAFGMFGIYVSVVALVRALISRLRSSETASDGDH